MSGRIGDFKISFFEEFPDKSNLLKLRLVKFPTKIYLAAGSYEDFLALKKRVLRVSSRVKDVVWWPVLETKDGYWISPFANYSALSRLCRELRDSSCSVMLDLEFPLRRGLIFKNTLRFSKNKRLLKHCISEFSRRKGKRLYSAEYMVKYRFLDKLFGFAGLSLNPLKYNSVMIKMFYSSMRHGNLSDMAGFVERYLKKYGNKFALGVGVIGFGVKGDEDILDVDGLLNDIRFAKKIGVSEVVIFRLGGLNRSYADAINAEFKSF